MCLSQYWCCLPCIIVSSFGFYFQISLLVPFLWCVYLCVCVCVQFSVLKSPNDAKDEFKGVASNEFRCVIFPPFYCVCVI